MGWCKIVLSNGENISSYGLKDNPYAHVTNLISAFNETRKNNVAPGTGVCIDESMGKWIPFFSDTPEGIPHLTKLIRKPVGVGSEYKCMADAFSGIMLFLELQQCKESMEQRNGVINTQSFHCD